MSIRTVVRWIGRGLLAVIFLVVAVFAAYRVRGPTQEQRAALALMQADYRPQQGVNAFPLLWFVRSDVPADQREARLKADVDRARLRLAGDESFVDFKTDAPTLGEPPSNDAALCEAHAPGCLAKAQAHGDAMRAEIAAHPVLVSRAEDFARTDFYWNEFPTDYRLVGTDIMNSPQRLWLSSFALKYVEDDRVGALSDVCQNIAAWRNSHDGNNTLIGAMLAQGYVDGSLRLFADMLAALPDETPAPLECNEALRPIAAKDIDRCAEMVGLYVRFTRSVDPDITVREKESWWDRAVRWAFVGPQAGSHHAEILSAYCGDSARVRMLSDRVVPPSTARPLLQRMDCIAGWVGCILAEISAPMYGEYDRRTLDFAAHLRLAATVLWLREGTEGVSVQARFEQRPPTLRSGVRHSGFDAARGVVFVDNLDVRREEHFELALRPRMNEP
jgi:hypothetical protein